VDSSMGTIELNVGSWVTMLERASGVNATYIGKPNPIMFEMAVRSMNLDKTQVVMVGDRVQTDIKGAKGYGIGSVLVRTGEFDERDLGGAVQPDFILDSVRDLLTIV